MNVRSTVLVRLSVNSLSGMQRGGLKKSWDFARGGGTVAALPSDCMSGKEMEMTGSHRVSIEDPP